ncbi:sugar-binding protein [Sciscionella sediminilitoris]|uniref:sugar-binding protein n=1 Tax=Sciscionella sediminilitoris TaxID=1445613 RepID=UPI00055DC7E1|nr:sugar-binding protein [Sciscionella sp. SE31]
MLRKSLLCTGIAALVLALLPGIGAAAPKSANPGHVDVLFIGAHPDDEHNNLATFGQWRENSGISTGVVTITRGEGGGNAVGPEEGPALGVLREGEERKAVGRAGVQDVHNLDKVDFFYTVSAPLTRKVWDEQDTLDRIVRLVRETTPSVIVTMNPAPVPGQHGNHQEAGRLATQAYYDAADPAKFTGQGLAPWSTGRLFEADADGSGGTGPDCPNTADNPAEQVYRVWEGAYSREHRSSWAKVQAQSARDYRSQGFGDTADPPTDPAKIDCDRFTQIDSRVPYTIGDTAPEAMLEGAALPGKGGLPKGTGLELRTSEQHPVPGSSFTATVTAHAPHGGVLPGARITPALPEGWSVRGDGRLDGNGKARFTVTVPRAAKTGTGYRIGAELRSAIGHGQTAREIEPAPALTAAPARLPQYADFDDWSARTGVPQLQGDWENTLSLGSGKSRTIPVRLHNNGERAESGTVRLDLPKGFTASPATREYRGLAPGADTTAEFTVAATDKQLPTANDGDYRYTVHTTSGAGSRDTAAALDLVPATSIPALDSAPKLDGIAGPGEYPGATLPISRRWEGDPCTSARDCSGYAKVSRHGDTLYVLTHVTDDKQGTALSAKDCKRHWRTDSVEIDIDPRGTGENTATTFKTGILPWTAEGGPCFERDADNHQGGAETAPGMRVAAKVDKPYTGYTVEAAIPLADLPSAVDPARMGLNILAYDSDTTDKTGQTRIGWSPFSGVQGDPYRWGHAELPGYQPPPDRPVQPSEPVIAKTAARSIDSPASIAQSARNGIPLAGAQAAPAADRASLAGPALLRGGTLTALVHVTGPGTAHLYVWSPEGKTLGSRTIPVPGPGARRIELPVTGTPPAGTRVLLGFAAEQGGTASSTAPILGN